MEKYFYGLNSNDKKQSNDIYDTICVYIIMFRWCNAFDPTKILPSTSKSPPYHLLFIYIHLGGDVELIPWSLPCISRAFETEDWAVWLYRRFINKIIKYDTSCKGAFLVTDNRVLNRPLGRSLRSFARTAHSLRSALLCYARFARLLHSQARSLTSLTPLWDNWNSWICIWTTKWKRKRKRKWWKRH